MDMSSFEELIKGPDLSPRPLDEMLQHAAEAQVFHFALKKNLFDELDSQEKRAAEIAEDWQADPRRTAALLDVLVAAGILEKREAGYRNSPLADTFLSKGSFFCLREVWERRLDSLKGLSQLEEQLTRPTKRDSCKTPRPPQFDPVAFTKMMEKNALARGSIYRLSRLISRHPRFYQARRLLDLGGSHGLYGVALCRLHPQLEGEVFELPEVAEVTQEYLQKYRMDHRLSARGGDMYQEDLGEGYHLVLAVNVLHRPPEILQDLMKRVWDSMEKGGVLYLQHRYLNRFRTAPRYSALFHFNRVIDVDAFHLPTLREALQAAREPGFVLTGVFRFARGDTCLRLERPRD